MPLVTTRTFNPLPFEHLEPKRFEDLARQLAYDFKPWRQLEATGRTGSDDGFDARGFEIVPSNALSEEDDDTPDEGATDRLWLIQCKREKSIGPSKMRAHLDAIPAESRADLYGLIFVAACDFSKKTRDILRLWCAEQGISECHVWGKAELEDFLYQPKNDNLLFAYFGISLHMRKQKIATNLRKITTIKRKIKRLFEKADQLGLVIIFRDPTDERYPFTEGKPLEKGDCLWRILPAEGLGLFGLKVLVREHFAYFDREKKRWDVATGYNQAIPHEHDNPWHDHTLEDESKKIEEAGRRFWLSIPGKEHYTAKFMAELHYEDIIEIDEIGNDEIKLITIFVSFRNGKIPLKTHLHPVITNGSQWGRDLVLDGSMPHVRVFPDEARDPEFDRVWQKNSKFSFAPERTNIDLTPPKWIDDLERMRAEKSRSPGDIPD